MNACDEIQSLLSAWVDGELSPAEAADVATHVTDCGECRAYVDALRELDANLRGFASRNQAAADRIAATVLTKLADSPPCERATLSEPVARSERAASSDRTTPNQSVDAMTVERDQATNAPARADVRVNSTARMRTITRIRTVAQYLAAAAAGFLLACMLFAPSGDRPTAENLVATGGTPRFPAAQGEPEKRPAVGQTPHEGTSTAGPVDLTLARLTVATGAVTMRQPGQSDWSAPDPKAPFQCAIGTEVRTPPGVQCELETKDRCTIRLNGETKLTLRSPREVELHSGQIWCRSPDDAALDVVTSTPGAPRTKDGAVPLRFTCPSNGSVVSEVNDGGDRRVFTASGEVDLRLGRERHRLKPGEVARVDGGRLIIEPYHADALLATRWMQPLLILKGHDSPELHERIDRMFANLGRSKLDNLYEDEIRSLGEHAVLPLLRFVQSPPSRDEPERRRRAMLIVSDMAPTWLVGELIDLLADDDPPIRVAAARALSRLTRQTHDRDPVAWTAPLEELAPSLERWRQWWRENASRYPRTRATTNTTTNTTTDAT